MTAVWQSYAAATATGGGDPVVSKPSGTVDGDLLIAYAIATAGHTVAAPDGSWTVLGASVGANGPIWAKIASSEPADYTFVVAGGLGNAQAVIVRVTGHDPATPIDVASGVASTSTLVIPSVTPTGADRLLLQVVAKNSNTSFTGPGSATERWDALGSPNNFGSAGGDETVGSGATGTRTWTPSSGSSTPGVGYMIAINPAPPIAGDVAGSTPVVTAALVGAIAGVLAASTLVPTASLTGTYEPPAIAGDLAGTTPKATSALSGSIHGVIDGTTASATGALAGILDGLIAAQTQAVLAALAGSLPGDLSPPTPKTQGALEGNYEPPDEGTGHLAGATPATVAELQGDYSDPPGALDATTPKTTGTLSGLLIGHASGATAETTATLAGTYTEPNPGHLAISTPTVTAALVGALVGVLDASTPKVTARLTDRPPQQHRATLVDLSRTHTITDLARTHEVTDRSRTVTITEV